MTDKPHAPIEMHDTSQDDQSIQAFYLERAEASIHAFHRARDDAYGADVATTFLRLVHLLLGPAARHQGMPEESDEGPPRGTRFLDRAWPPFALLLFSDPIHGVLRTVRREYQAQQRSAIESLCALYRQRGAGIHVAGATYAAAAVTAAHAATAAGARGDTAAAYAAFTAYAAASGNAVDAAAWARSALVTAGMATQEALRQWQAATLRACLRGEQPPERSHV